MRPGAVRTKANPGAAIGLIDMTTAHPLFLEGVSKDPLLQFKVPRRHKCHARCQKKGSNSSVISVTNHTTWATWQHGQGALLQRPRTLKPGAEGAPGRRRRVALFNALAASAGSRPSFWPTTPLLPIFSSSPSLIITTIFLEMHSPAPLAGHAHPQTRCPSRCPRAPQAAYKHPSFAADDRRGGHSHQKSAHSSVQCHEIAQSPRCDRLPPQRIAESHSQPRGQPTNCFPHPPLFFFSSSPPPILPTIRRAGLKLRAAPT